MDLLKELIKNKVFLLFNKIIEQNGTQLVTKMNKILKLNKIIQIQLQEKKFMSK